MPAGALGVLLASTGTSGLANANGETRTLEIYHTHTRESASITYKRNGQFDKDALEKLNWILRDWRRDEPTSMDPRLFDIVWEVHREVGSNEPLHIVSAYRAPETNAMLRRRSRQVAKHSQHMLGKAMDFQLPDVSMSKVREVGMRLQRGGVGYYPTSNPFVHLDAGSVRHWPRMTRDQLTRLFPDGKTVHIPSDGKPMPGYDVAAAEIERYGGTVSAYADAGDEDEGLFGSKGKSFFAALFGSRDDEAQQTRAQVNRRSTRVARAEEPENTVEPYETVTRGSPIVSGGAAAVAQAPAAAEAPPQPSPAPAPQAKPVAVAALAPEPALQQQPAGRSAQPQLVWEAGPAGAARPDGAEAANEGPVVPLPLSRPRDLESLVAAADVPLPPSRPVEVASLLPIVPSAETIGVAETISAPPGDKDVSAYAPMPPVRPTALVTASLAPQPGPPPQHARAEAPLAVGGQTASAAELDRTGLKSLFSAAATGLPKTARVRTAKAHIAVTNVRGLTDSPASSVVMGFGTADDMTTERFSGPAVKALAVAKFQP
jgi:uncharacterized protein YcbK (DUF882 family)